MKHKIAVYTIVKNAEKYIADWIEAGRDADLLVLGDTGSTDNTVKIARKLGAKVYKIKPDEPFHFGNARNALLSVLPDDISICLSIDADELLVDGWRESVENEWNGSLMSIASITDGRLVWISRIHCRNAVWVDRIHEYIFVAGATQDKSSVKIIHNQDRDRDRNFYIDLLLLQIEENPRARHYALLGKELASRGRIGEATNYLEKYFDFTIEHHREAASVANLLYYMTHNVSWLYKSISICPIQREAYQRIMVYLAHNDDWTGAYHFGRMADEYSGLEMFHEYVLSDEAFFTILAEASFNTGRIGEAVEIGKRLALEYGKHHKENLAGYSNPTT